MKRATPWFLVAVLALVLLVEEWRLRRPGAPVAGRERELDVRPASARAGSLAPELAAPEPEAPARREAVASPAVSEQPSRPPSATLAQQWLARYRERPKDTRHGQRVTEELLGALAPDEALGVIGTIWTELTDAHRQALLLPSVGSCHERVLEILDLAVRDPLPSVQKAGLMHLRSFSFQSFEEDFPAYIEWFERVRGLPPGQVIRDSIAVFVASLGTLSGPELRARLSAFNVPPTGAGESCGLDTRALFEAQGALALVRAWLFSADQALERCAFRWVSVLRPEEAWMRANVLPFAGSEEGNTRAEALGALGHPDHRWAIPFLLERLRTWAALHEDGYRSSQASSAAMALGRIGDPAVIPELIQILAAHGERIPRLNYDIGWFGLNGLTGVNYDESHDTGWWLDWWERNRARFAGPSGR